MVRFALLAATFAAAGCATGRRAVSGVPPASDGTGAGATRIERQAFDRSGLAGPISMADRLPMLERLGGLPAEDDGRTASAEGYWLWENSSVMPDGDERSEREEWHLVQDGSKIAGHYDRWVRQVSTDGHPYRCSGNLDFRVGTRYHVTGEVRDGAVAVYERRFDVLEGGPCDPGSRRLDAYQGRIRGDEIRLMFGTGIQVLRRSRPDVPSQRF